MVKLQAGEESQTTNIFHLMRWTKSQLKGQLKLDFMFYAGISQARILTKLIRRVCFKMSQNKVLFLRICSDISASGILKRLNADFIFSHKTFHPQNTEVMP